jgi:hypothetical protein
VDGLHQQPCSQQPTALVFHNFCIMMMDEVRTRQIYLQNKDKTRFNSRTSITTIWTKEYYIMTDEHHNIWDGIQYEIYNIMDKYFDGPGLTQWTIGRRSWEWGQRAGPLSSPAWRCLTLSNLKWQQE